MHSYFRYHRTINKGKFILRLASPLITCKALDTTGHKKLQRTVQPAHSTAPILLFRGHSCFLWNVFLIFCQELNLYILFIVATWTWLTGNCDRKFCSGNEDLMIFSMAISSRQVNIVQCMSCVCRMKVMVVDISMYVCVQKTTVNCIYIYIYVFFTVVPTQPNGHRQRGLEYVVRSLLVAYHRWIQDLRHTRLRFSHLPVCFLYLLSFS